MKETQPRVVINTFLLVSVKRWNHPKSTKGNRYDEQQSVCLQTYMDWTKVAEENENVMKKNKNAQCTGHGDHDIEIS